jgi:hypothetical protein
MRLAPDKTDYGSLAFLVGTDSFECVGGCPESAASRAFAYSNRADAKGFQGNFTTWAFTGSQIVEHRNFARFRTAMRAKFCSKEHQAQTFGTTNGLQPRTAKLALGLVAHHRTAAVWAV